MIGKREIRTAINRSKTIILNNVNSTLSFEGERLFYDRAYVSGHYKGSLTDLYSVRVKIRAFLASEKVAQIKSVLKSILES